MLKSVIFIPFLLSDFLGSATLVFYTPIRIEEDFPSRQHP